MKRMLSLLVLGLALLMPRGASAEEEVQALIVRLELSPKRHVSVKILGDSLLSRLHAAGVKTHAQLVKADTSKLAGHLAHTVVIAPRGKGPRKQALRAAHRGAALALARKLQHNARVHAKQRKRDDKKRDRIAVKGLRKLVE